MKSDYALSALGLFEWPNQGVALAITFRAFGAKAPVLWSASRIRVTIPISKS